MIGNNGLKARMAFNTVFIFIFVVSLSLERGMMNPPQHGMKKLFQKKTLNGKQRNS